MWWQSNTTINISIHALLAESDHFATLKFVNPYISIHALLAESDIDLRNIIRTRLVFLSTLSLRRATQVHRYRLKNHHYFYPRSPCGERLTVFSIFQVVIIFLSTLSLRRATVYLASQTFDIDISIHALLAESDICAFWTALSRPLFLSTLSLRRATIISKTDRCTTIPFLSTLSLRRATRFYHETPARRRYFYPRSPCGERRSSNFGKTSIPTFLSTLSLRRATVGTSQVFQRIAISIHALLAESDPTSGILRFYPLISIHALLAESDVCYMIHRLS